MTDQEALERAQAIAKEHGLEAELVPGALSVEGYWYREEPCWIYGGFDDSFYPEDARPGDPVVTHWCELPKSPSAKPKKKKKS